MAKDTLEVISHLEWTLPRQLHVVGVSMGGMIAQELALMIPDRIASLTLASTAARLVNTVGYWENLRNRINMVGNVFNLVSSRYCRYYETLASNAFISEEKVADKGMPAVVPPDDQLDDMKNRMFSQRWLDAPDDYGEFPTNGDRFAAMELEKRQDVEGFTRKGFVCQAIAAGWHYKSPQQLKELANKVGRERIQILHGTLDKMITLPHGETLAKELGEKEGVTKIIVDGRGHVLHIEERDMYIKALESIVEKAENLK
ncbi:MAG: hypothetical protein LQ343_000558 [Gyalolechia ehrenbergii]|nr:MAG: hypothetical protein LQ343_000558 [Gyalolechia ehrenbergii]